MLNHIMAEFFRAKNSVLIKGMYLAGIIVPVLILFVTTLMGIPDEFMRLITDIEWMGGVYATVIVARFCHKSSDIKAVNITYGTNKIRSYIYDFVSGALLITTFAVLEFIYVLALAFLFSGVSDVIISSTSLDLFFNETFISVIRALILFNNFFALLHLFDSPAMGISVSLALGIFGFLFIYDAGNTANGLLIDIISLLSAHFYALERNVIVLKPWVFLCSIVAFFMLGLNSYARREL